MGGYLGFELGTITGSVHKLMLRKAYEFASQNSDDPTTQVGALIYNSNTKDILSLGTNHLPLGIVPTEEQKLNREWKLEHIIHAEQSAIFSAAKQGKSTDGATMYMPWVPCTSCAKSIIDSGIETLISHKEMVIKTPERWFKSTGYAIELLKKCNVDYYIFEGNLGGIKMLFGGNIWEP